MIHAFAVLQFVSSLCSEAFNYWGCVCTLFLIPSSGPQSATWAIRYSEACGGVFNFMKGEFGFLGLVFSTHFDAAILYVAFCRCCKVRWILVNLKDSFSFYHWSSDKEFGIVEKIVHKMRRDCSGSLIYWRRSRLAIHFQHDWNLICCICKGADVAVLQFFNECWCPSSVCGARLIIITTCHHKQRKAI